MQIVQYTTTCSTRCRPLNGFRKPFPQNQWQVINYKNPRKLSEDLICKSCRQWLLSVNNCFVIKNAKLGLRLEGTIPSTTDLTTDQKHVKWEIEDRDHYDSQVHTVLQLFNPDLRAFVMVSFFAAIYLGDNIIFSLSSSRWYHQSSILTRALPSLIALKYQE